MKGFKQFNDDYLLIKENRYDQFSSPLYIGPNLRMYPFLQQHISQKSSAAQEIDIKPY